MAEVGGVRSSVDPVLDLWFGENTGERRDATCSAVRRSNEGCGDGPQGLPAPKKVRQLQITLYRKAKSSPGYRFWSLYGALGSVLTIDTQERGNITRTAHLMSTEWKVEGVNA